MINLKDLPDYKQELSIFKSFWDLFMECILLVIFLMMIIANGLKLAKEQYLCMPLTVDSNYTSIGEYKSMAISEFVSQLCYKEKNILFVAYEICGFIVPVLIFFTSIVFVNWPSVLYKLSKLQEILEKCNSHETKKTMKQIHDEYTVCDVMPLKIFTEEIKQAFEFKPNLRSFYNICMLCRCVFCVGYIIFLAIYIHHTSGEEKIKCDIKTKTPYGDQFLCWHSLRELYKNIAIPVTVLVSVYTVTVVIYWIGIIRCDKKKWTVPQKLIVPLKNDFKFALCLAYYKKEYFECFFDMLSKTFQDKLKKYGGKDCSEGMRYQTINEQIAFSVQRNIPGRNTIGCLYHKGNKKRLMEVQNGTKIYIEENCQLNTSKINYKEDRNPDLKMLTNYASNVYSRESGRSHKKQATKAEENTSTNFRRAAVGFTKGQMTKSARNIQQRAVIDSEKIRQATHGADNQAAGIRETLNDHQEGNTKTDMKENAEENPEEKSLKEVNPDDVKVDIPSSKITTD